jgi:hypothetical protein
MYAEKHGCERLEYSNFEEDFRAKILDSIRGKSEIERDFSLDKQRKKI